MISIFGVYFIIHGRSKSLVEFNALFVPRSTTVEKYECIGLIHVMYTIMVMFVFILLYIVGLRHQ